MKKDNFVLRIAILLLVIPAIVSSGCSKKKVEQKEEVKVPVVVSKPVAGTVTKVYKTTGTISAEDVSFLGFPMPGRIVEMSVDAGDKVTVGQVLARQDAVQALEGVNAAKAAYGAASDAVQAQEKAFEVSGNQLENARNQFAKVEADYKRFEKLYADQVVTKKEFEDIETAYKSAKLGVENASRAVEAAELQVNMIKGQADAAAAHVDQAKQALSETTLVAPYDGTITEKRMNVGDVPGSGTTVFKITANGKRKISIRIPEEYHGKIQTGDKVDIKLDYYPDQVIHAEIYKVVTDISAYNRAFSVEVFIPEGFDALPGSFAQVELALEKAENAMTIPIEALLSFGDGQGVYINKNGVAVKRLLKVGLVEGETVQVVDGLTWDDEVVVVGNRFLTEGAKLQVGKAGDAGS